MCAEWSSVSHPAIRSLRNVERAGPDPSVRTMRRVVKNVLNPTVNPLCFSCFSTFRTFPLSQLPHILLFSAQKGGTGPERCFPVSEKTPEESDAFSTHDPGRLIPLFYAHFCTVSAPFSASWKSSLRIMGELSAHHGGLYGPHGGLYGPHGGLYGPHCEHDAQCGIPSMTHSVAYPA